MAVDEHVDESPENVEKTPKRKRETSVLDNFAKLTNGNEKIRIKSGVALLKHLTENEEKAETEVKYALGRLIRGLGSAKQQTKIGFFATLVGLLNLKTVSVEEILQHVSKELHKGGSNSKSENADVCSGRILVAGAIFRSTLYENCNDEEKTKVLELLLAAGKERTYLSLAAYKFLIGLFCKIDSHEFEKLVFPVIKAELSKSWQEQDLDSLYLLTETMNRFPQSVKAKFLKNNLGTSEIICAESLPYLCNTLVTIPRVLALKHPIFELFIEKICNSELLGHFFEQLDQTLTKPNRNRYFAATKLLSGVLEKVQEPSLVPDLLTKNYIRQTLDTYKTSVGKLKDKEFEAISKKLFDNLLSSLKRDCVKDKIKIKVLKKLLFYPGTFIFEKITKSKLIQNITAILKTEGVKKMAAIYRDVILATNDRTIKENVAEKWWNIDRVYASRLMVKLLNHPVMQSENDWKVEQMTCFLKLGMLKDETGSVGHDLADSFKETFYSSLDLKLGKLSDLRGILSKLNQVVCENYAISRHPLAEENYETWQRSLELSKKIEESPKKRNAVFHTLFLHLNLQLFNNAKLASESLKELFSCYERIKKAKKIEENTEDPMWIEVVVDLFLNLLSHNSHLLRTVIGCVFPHLCKYMNGDAVHQILAVLDPKNDTNPLSNIDEDSEESSGSENDDVDDKEDDDDDDDKEDDDDEKEDEPSNDKLRLALRQVLGANVNSDAESEDLDNLDEEEGEKLNEALGQAFRQFRPNLGKKKKQDKDEQTLTHFRVRALDLIEIYLSSTPSMLLTLEIMLPLLQTLEFCVRDDHQKPLRDRVGACLKKLTSVKKFSDFEDVTNRVLVGLLQSLLAKGTKNTIIVQEMGEKIAECCTFIIYCSQTIRSGITKKKNKIKAIVHDGVEEFFTKRDCLVPYVLLKSLMQLTWEGIADLIPLLTRFVFDDAIRPFRRHQAIELLKLFYNNHRFAASRPEEAQKIDETTDSFLRNCSSFFGDAPRQNVKEKFFCGAFELLSAVKSSSFAKDWEGWQGLGEVVRDCRSQVTFATDTKVAFGKLCKNLNISKVVQMKRQVVTLSNGGDEEGETKREKQKKKRKSNKEQLKLKKESKELRLSSLSEGLSKRKISWEDADENKKIKSS